MLPALNTLKLESEVEPYAPASPPKLCKPVPQPGVVKFSKWVMQNVGGGNSGIVRECGKKGAISHHNEGRGWDWKLDADKPEDQALFNQLIAWLFGTGPSGEPYEMLRRTGIDYIIWDKKIWTARGKEWEPYNRTGSKTVEHRDHAHFSFSWPGAKATTSFYQWLDAGQPVGPAPVIPLTTSDLLSSKVLIPAAVGVVIGLATIGALYDRKA